ncbi:hypothetical protein P7C71_g1429, partial [Lecanoromycetidae sp. Uapishka_2]
MSYSYGSYGATAALGVVGLCTSCAHSCIEVIANGGADLLFTGDGEAFNVGQFLESVSPYAWADLGIGLCIGLSVVGAAWFVKILVIEIFSSVLGLFGLIIGLLVSGKAHDFQTG